MRLLEFQDENQTFLGHEPSVSGMDFFFFLCHFTLNIKTFSEFGLHPLTPSTLFTVQEKGDSDSPAAPQEISAYQ